jgi:hypothetical protein
MEKVPEIKYWAGKVTAAEASTAKLTNSTVNPKTTFMIISNNNNIN